MAEIVVKIPDEFASEKSIFEKKMKIMIESEIKQRRLEFASEKSIFEKKMKIMIESEIKQRRLIKLIDKIMESANQLNDEELIRLGDEFKEAGIKELRNKGILI